MQDNDDFSTRRVSNAWSLETAGGGLLRITLLFGSVAVALAMLITPMVDRVTRRSDAAVGIDTVSTGSIRGGNRYTIRRSVLQPSPDSICIIRESGARSGNC